jgi:hypothetical protein
MGHFSMEKSLNPGSVLGGNQHHLSAEKSRPNRISKKLAAPP